VSGEPDPRPWWKRPTGERAILIASVALLWEPEKRKVGFRLAVKRPDGPQQPPDARYGRISERVELLASRWDATPPEYFVDPDSGQPVCALLHVHDLDGHPAWDRGLGLARALLEALRVDLATVVRVAVEVSGLKCNIPEAEDTWLGMAFLSSTALNRVTSSQSVDRILVSDDTYFCKLDHDLAQRPPRHEPLDAVFEVSERARMWEELRRHVVQDPMIARLRYVGFKLRRGEPPSLALREVFTPLAVRRMERRGGGNAVEALPDPDEKEPEAGAARGTADQTEPVAFDRVAWGREAEEGAFGAPQPFAQAFRGERSMILVGDPGSGKTTLLRWLALMSVLGPVADAQPVLHGDPTLPRRRLPLLASIGQLARLRAGRSLIEALAAVLGERGVFAGRGPGQVLAFLEHERRIGFLLLLLDGLDEVDSSERHGVQQWLESNLARERVNRVILTSRRVGFVAPELPDADVYAVEPFDDAQVRGYVQAFTAAYLAWESNVPAAPAEQARQVAEDLLQALGQVPRLRSLARNPFLLSALALIHRAEGRLPHHRVLVYERFAETLCETWSAARQLVAGGSAGIMGYASEAVPILGHLAVRMHEEHPDGIAPEAFVLTELARALHEERGVPEKAAREAAREFLRRAGERAQILFERAPGQWGFFHLTFQEFFAAVGLLASDRFKQAVRERLLDDRWEEVLRLGVAHMALVQGRAREVNEMVSGARDFHVAPPWEELSRLLQLPIPRATLLAAEAASVLRPTVRDETVQAFAAWVVEWPTLALEPARKLGLTLLKDDVARRIAPHWQEWGVLGILAALRSTEALVALEQALRSFARGVRWNAVVLLGDLGGPESEALLRQFLEDKDGSVRLRAVVGLAKSGGPGAEAALRQALKDGEWRVRMEAAIALGGVGGRGSEAVLQELMRDDNGGVRAQAVLALGRIGGPGSDVALAGALGDEDITVRVLAVLALGLRGGRTAEIALRQAMSDKAAVVRAQAVSALGRLGGPEAEAQLRAALADESGSVRVHAAVALEQRDGGAAAGALRKEAQSEDEHVRVEAVVALGQLSGPEPEAMLQEALHDRVERVRMLAAQALGQRGCPDAEAVLLAAMKGERSFVRGEAAAALGRGGGPKAEAALQEALIDKEPDVRAKAAVALGEIGGLGTARLLRDHLKFEDGHVRAQIAAALAKCVARHARTPARASGAPRA